MILDPKTEEAGDQAGVSNDRPAAGEVNVNGQGAEDARPESAVYPPLRSEDSGLGLSASPSEQQLFPGHDSSILSSGICSETENVWRKGGRVENMSKCVRDILASIIIRCATVPYI